MRIPQLRRPPDCEFTAPGAETEAMDCWEPATHRRVDSDGVTSGLFCGPHSRLSHKLGHKIEKMADDPEDR
jgi:hypothetical protein